MRYFRARSPLDDLIGGLVYETRRELSAHADPLRQGNSYDEIFRSAANALAQEVRRSETILPDFLARRTNFGDRADRAPLENYWGVQVGEGILTKAPLEAGYNWPRALAYAHQTIIESVYAELREEGIL